MFDVWCFCMFCMSTFCYMIFLLLLLLLSGFVMVFIFSLLLLLLFGIQDSGFLVLNLKFTNVLRLCMYCVCVIDRIRLSWLGFFLRFKLLMWMIFSLCVCRMWVCVSPKLNRKQLTEWAKLRCNDFDSFRSYFNDWNENETWFGLVSSSAFKIWFFGFFFSRIKTHSFVCLLDCQDNVLN